MEIKTTLEIPVTIKVYGARPGRPAPYCRNPSSPEYADPGDPPEYERAEIDIFVEPFRRADADYFREEVQEQINDIIIEYIEEHKYDNLR